MASFPADLWWVPFLGLSALALWAQLLAWRAGRAAARPVAMVNLRPGVPRWERRSPRLELEIHTHGPGPRKAYRQKFGAGLRGWALHLPLPWGRRCLCVDYFEHGKRP